MAERLYCALNGVSFSSLDESIRLLDVQEISPTLRSVTADRHTDGTYLLARHRASLQIRLRFLIAEYGVARRSELLHRVMAWAEQGGNLTLEKQGMRVLSVVCTSFPSLSALNWLETLSLTLTAYDCPYWEDADATVLTMTDTLAVTAPGTAPETPLDVLITNAGSAALTRISITAAQRITLSGLSIPSGGQLRIHHDAGYFAVESKLGGISTSVLSCRTPDSADDLTLLPGQAVVVSISADAAIQAELRFKGRYC